MELLKRTHLFMLFLLVLLLTAGVGKKKHLEAVSALESEKALQEAQYKVQLDNANDRIDELLLQLAERKGENNALLGMQDRYENQIRALEDEIEQMNSKASDQQASMGKDLEEKEKIIAEQNRKMQAVEKILSGDETAVIQLANSIQKALPDLSPDELMIEVKDGKATITLYEKLMFRSGSVSRLNSGGYEALQKIAEVLQAYPGMFITVVAHTDNKPPAIKSYKDNWNFSVLRAATIVRTMVGEFEIGANQILASGKGEFEPSASNETSEGRAQNRRIELIIAPSIEDQARRIRAALK